jgi:hypothetical protein
VVIVVIVMIMVAITVTIAVVVVIPLVVMFEASSIAFPVTLKIEAAIVARSHPVCASIRGKSPIALVPTIVSVYRIPVTVDPNVVGPRTRRRYVHDPGSGRRANSNANTNLRVRAVTAEQKHCGE